jgi:hypothetical protein
MRANVHASRLVLAFAAIAFFGAHKRGHFTSPLSKTFQIKIQQSAVPRNRKEMDCNLFPGLLLANFG